MIHRDEIHGDIRYDPLAVALLDTPQLQRLGRVYQLGFGHLIYRGGTHTRLSHSMGAYFTASRLVTALHRNYEGDTRRPQGALEPDDFLPRGRPEGARETSLADRWAVFRHVVRWAALLHDVGHVPLGHTLEDEFDGIYESHDAFASPRLRHIWFNSSSEIAATLRRDDLYPDAFGRLGMGKEDVFATVLLICTWKERVLDDGERVPFELILNEAEAENKGIAQGLLTMLATVSSTAFHPYMADLVANTISADYLDYLRRDPHNLGLDVLRDDRVVSRFWIGRDDLAQPRMALSLVDRRGKPRLDTCTGVVELVRQRYRFAEVVYYHKTKVAASAMLAKVFQLLDSPDEVPQPRTLPTIDDAGRRVDAVLGSDTARSRGRELTALRQDCTPSALLDPEIGDEGLGLLLRQRALDQLDRAIKGADRDTAVDAVRSIALLDGLARRRLYKTVFTMSAESFPRLSACDERPVGDRERELKEFIVSIRGDAKARQETERLMIESAGWPQCSLLIYVPDRKSQAKGIETGALAGGKVVTLGLHQDVEKDVKQLGRRYEQLWKLIVLVHPDYARDVIGMSKAIDAFVEHHFPETRIDDDGVLAELRKAAWFPYLRRSRRSAAEEYSELLSSEPIDFSVWDIFAEYGNESEPCTATQHARGAAVAQRVAELTSDGAIERKVVPIVARLGTAAEIEGRIKAILAEEKANAALGGDDGSVDLNAVRRVVGELARQALE